MAPRGAEDGSAEDEGASTVEQSKGGRQSLSLSAASREASAPQAQGLRLGDALGQHHPLEHRLLGVESIFRLLVDQASIAVEQLPGDFFSPMGG